MKRLVIGILAHVDAGKTTLTEGLLYAGGALRSLGRVDYGSTFLDTEQLERERGITIFSKQALLHYAGTELLLLDTPGHVDFSAEMERTLQVLDYAILVISGTDGVQSHTRTLWQLLERYHIPTFLFINKMDLQGADRHAVLQNIQEELSDCCVDFGTSDQARDEAVALCDESALEQFLEYGAIETSLLQTLISKRRLFPCCFGSALKMDGVETLLSLLARFGIAPSYGPHFGAKVFKISRDAQGNRLTHLKVTGGTLQAKSTVLSGAFPDREEKVDQIRLYSGAKFRPLDQAVAGEVVAVTGLENTYPGQGLGFEPQGISPTLEPILTYQLILPDGTDPYSILPKLRQLEDEDPMLRILWQEERREIHVQLMGQIQLEILQRLIAERFSLPVQFGEGSIAYRETITDTVEGVGHFEPLRHYAEVHLLLEPGERGSGIQTASTCPTDTLDLNWQRLIMTHLTERKHPGVLTGSPLTDVKITLLNGRAHLKHTEGGDFRQATYRAIRQGLMQAKSILLEPCYNFRLELPSAQVGRAINDLQTMGGQIDSPQTKGDRTILTGSAPVAALRNYWQEVATYTRGLGHLSFSFRGYEPCKNEAEIIQQSGYDPERDTDHPTGSIFCEHGAGVYVKWDEVKQRMHLQSSLSTAPEEDFSPPRGKAASSRAMEEDKELLQIFENTYGKIQHSTFQPPKPPARTSLDDSRYRPQAQRSGPEYLLVDGYNIIFAWDELKALAADDISAARETLIDLLANYRAFRQCEVILVFDAYKVKGNPGSVEKRNGIYLVYTKEAETADSYIERTTYDLGKDHRVRVATSDNLEQVIILGHGALRISARAFEREVREMQGQMSELIARHNRKGLTLRRIKNTATIKPSSEPPKAN